MKSIHNIEKLRVTLFVLVSCLFIIPVNAQEFGKANLGLVLLGTFIQTHPRNSTHTTARAYLVAVD